MLYCTPVWLSNTMVPLGTAQVGCTTLPTVGAEGGVGAVLIIIVEPVVIQVVSAVFRTQKV